MRNADRAIHSGVTFVITAALLNLETETGGFFTFVPAIVQYCTERCVLTGKYPPSNAFHHAFRASIEFKRLAATIGETVRGVIV